MKKEALKISHNNIPPSKTCVLISEPFLQDSSFQRSVIFLTEYSEKGAMGFVLNKPLDLSLSDLIKGINVSTHLPVYYGGPVDVDILFFIHTLSFIPESYPISDKLFLNGDFEFLIDYINSGVSLEGKIKFFFGYSGWSGGQLETEITENSWLVGKLSEEELFEPHDEKVWTDALLKLGEKYRAWTRFPKNPELN